MEVTAGESVRILQELQELQELSQTHLSKLSEIAQAIISAIENDRVNMGVERAKTLAPPDRARLTVALHDLYAERFDPVQPSGESANTASTDLLVEQHCEELARIEQEIELY